MTPELGHFGGGFKVKLVVEKGKTRPLGHPFFVRKVLSGGRRLLFARVDAKQNVVGVVILLLDVVRIVGGNDFDVVLAGQSN